MLSHIEKKYFDMITPQIEKGSKTEDNYTRCCPICREGNSFPRKKRFHMYNKKGMKFTLVHCFNCGYHKSFKNFLKEYYPTEYQMLMNETRNEQLESLKSISNNMKLEAPKVQGFEIKENVENAEIQEQEDLFDKPKIIFDIPEKFQKLPSKAIEYLEKRKIPKSFYEKWYYCNDMIEINSKKIILKDYIIIPFYYKDKLYGFQALKYTEKKFYIYLPTENYKIWNLYNIDKTKTIYVAESIFDAISMGFNKDEIISQMGISLPQEISKEIKVVFCLDNQLVDETSYKESLKLLQEGKSVFIWPKGSEKFKDFNDLAKANVPLEKIKKLIKKNTFTSFEGVVRLKLLKN